MSWQKSPKSTLSADIRSDSWLDISQQTPTATATTTTTTMSTGCSSGFKSGSVTFATTNYVPPTTNLAKTQNFNNQTSNKQTTMYTNAHIHHSDLGAALISDDTNLAARRRCLAQRNLSASYGPNNLQRNSIDLGLQNAYRQYQRQASCVPTGNYSPQDDDTRNKLTKQPTRRPHLAGISLFGSRISNKFSKKIKNTCSKLMMQKKLINNSTPTNNKTQEMLCQVNNNQKELGNKYDELVQALHLATLTNSSSQNDSNNNSCQRLKRRHSFLMFDRGNNNISSSNESDKQNEDLSKEIIIKEWLARHQQTWQSFSLHLSDLDSEMCQSDIIRPKIHLPHKPRPASALFYSKPSNNNTSVNPNSQLSNIPEQNKAQKQPTNRYRCSSVAINSNCFISPHPNKRRLTPATPATTCLPVDCVSLSSYVAPRDSSASLTRSSSSFSSFNLSISSLISLNQSNPTVNDATKMNKNNRPLVEDKFNTYYKETDDETYEQTIEQDTSNNNNNNDDDDDYAEPSDDEWRLNRSQVDLVQIIGEGQRGFVFLAKLQTANNCSSNDNNKQTIQDVAVKSLKYETKQNIDKLLAEALMMQQFEHPHIIKFYGLCDQSPALIVMELANLGDVKTYLRDNKHLLSSSLICLFVFQLSTALSYIESKQFVHRDVAARNVLVSAPDCVKLADFGLAQPLAQCAPMSTTPAKDELKIKNKQDTGKLPVRWLAPESLAFRHFTSASDVWMFAVCSWELFYLGERRPWASLRNSQVLKALQDNQRLEQPPSCPTRLYKLLLSAWQFVPAKRPKFKELKHDLWSIYLQQKAYDQQKSLASLPRNKPNSAAPIGAHQKCKQVKVNTNHVDQLTARISPQSSLQNLCPALEAASVSASPSASPYHRRAAGIVLQKQLSHGSIYLPQTLDELRCEDDYVIQTSSPICKKLQRPLSVEYQSSPINRWCDFESEKLINELKEYNNDHDQDIDYSSESLSNANNSRQYEKINIKRDNYKHEPTFRVGNDKSEDRLLWKHQSRQPSPFVANSNYNTNSLHRRSASFVLDTHKSNVKANCLPGNNVSAPQQLLHTQEPSAMVARHQLPIDKQKANEQSFYKPKLGLNKIPMFQSETPVRNPTTFLHLHHQHLYHQNYNQAQQFNCKPKPSTNYTSSPGWQFADCWLKPPKQQQQQQMYQNISSSNIQQENKNKNKPNVSSANNKLPKTTASPLIASSSSPSASPCFKCLSSKPISANEPNQNHLLIPRDTSQKAHDKQKAIIAKQQLHQHLLSAGNVKFANPQLANNTANTQQTSKLRNNLQSQHKVNVGSSTSSSSSKSFKSTTSVDQSLQLLESLMGEESFNKLEKLQITHLESNNKKPKQTSKRMARLLVDKQAYR